MRGDQGASSRGNIYKKGCLPSVGGCLSATKELHRELHDGTCYHQPKRLPERNVNRVANVMDTQGETGKWKVRYPLPRDLARKLSAICRADAGSLREAISEAWDENGRLPTIVCLRTMALLWRGKEGVSFVEEFRSWAPRFAKKMREGKAVVIPPFIEWEAEGPKEWAADELNGALLNLGRLPPEKLRDAALRIVASLGPDPEKYAAAMKREFPALADVCEAGWKKGMELFASYGEWRNEMGKPDGNEALVEWIASRVEKGETEWTDC